MIAPAPVRAAPSAWRAFRRTVRRYARTMLRATPRTPVSTWAAQHLRLSAEYAAEPGQWDPDRNPPMREIMDAMGDPEVPEVVVMCAAQQGKTTAVIATMMRHIHEDPGPMLLMLPTLELARSFSLERIKPTVRDCAALRPLVHDPAARDSNSTILALRFHGGTLWQVGANSAASLSSRPVRYVFVDEVDRAPATVGGEGSPVGLVWKRAAAFHNRKLVMTSTPTLSGSSVIADYYGRGDQRRYLVPCRHCGARWPLEWEHLKWERDADGEHLPETAALVCRECGGVHTEQDKPALVRAGEWVATHPGRRLRSYHLNALASPFLTWADLVRAFLEARRSRHTLQTWVNTVLAETFTAPEDEPAEAQVHALTGRLERYAAPTPDGVRIITGGADVQDNRIELSLWGWGEGEEGWHLTHEILEGSPATDAVWAALDARLGAVFTRADGTTLPILACGIDTGGHHTQAVYRFVSRRWNRPRGRLLALKGHPQPGAPLLTKKPTTANAFRVPLWAYGATAAKDEFFGRLSITAPGPRFLHLPDTVEPEFVEQLLGEVPYIQPRGPATGRRVYRKRRKRTEALDCALYALLALEKFGRSMLPASATPRPAAPAAEEEPVALAPFRNIGMEAAFARARGRTRVRGPGYLGMPPHRV